MGRRRALLHQLAEKPNAGWVPEQAVEVCREPLRLMVAVFATVACVFDSHLLRVCSNT